MGRERCDGLATWEVQRTKTSCHHSKPAAAAKVELAKTRLDLLLQLLLSKNRFFPFPDSETRLQTWLDTRDTRCNLFAIDMQSWGIVIYSPSQFFPSIRLVGNYDK